VVVATLARCPKGGIAARTGCIANHDTPQGQQDRIRPIQQGRADPEFDTVIGYAAQDSLRGPGLQQPINISSMRSTRLCFRPAINPNDLPARRPSKRAQF